MQITINIDREPIVADVLTVSSDEFTAGGKFITLQLGELKLIFDGFDHLSAVHALEVGDALQRVGAQLRDELLAAEAVAEGR